MTEPLALNTAEAALEAVHTRRHDAYPAYRSSNIEWLGDVPEHWEVKSLRHLGKAKMGLTYSPENVVLEGEGTLVLRAGNIRDGRITDADNVYVDVDVPDQLITRPKDILICSRSGSRSLIGKNALISENHAGSTFGAFMTVFRSQYNDFLYWVLNSRLFEFYSGAFMTTTINQLTLGTLRTFLTPFPPVEEQQAITRFLDEQTKKIDDLIEAKRSLLDLLKEKREAVITRAVTHGLDPSAKLKPSGAEWLGDVPEHWTTQHLKYIASVQFSNVDKHTVEGEIPVRLCNYTDVYYNDTITEDLQFMEASATEHEIFRFKLEPSDVLVTKDSEEWSDIAVPALVVDEFEDVLCGYHLAQIRPDPNYCIGPYLARAFASSRIMYQLHVAASGVTRYGLPKNALRDALFPLPSLEEQRAIARFLDEQTEKIDNLESIVREAIASLELLRSSLISAAVTGKIDVRGERV